MNLDAAIANALWSASNLPAYVRFRGALRRPQAVQEQKLRAYLQRSSHTAFGRAHSFESIGSYDEFTRRVPLADYESFEPWIKRIRGGESNVLTHEPVTHLVPTSGSAGARKLIPFTAGLQREFNAAIGPWLVDLQRQSPGVIAGPAYWSVTPSPKGWPAEESAVPVGFDSDMAYLAGARRRLAAAAMAVPADVQRTQSVEAFRYETLLHLLRCRELRLISCWHPSFLALLLDALPAHWESMLNDIGRGRPGSLVPLPRRKEELRHISPHEPALLWPELRLISCWGDGNAEFGIADIKRRFPEVFIQRKGLLATEAFVTIPFAGWHPLAIRSHFFEFIDAGGRTHLAHQLREGERYEVVVTTGGGLWRYRLRDQVHVDGFLQGTPCMRFLGRTGNVSDRFGEKLSESFVAHAIREAMAGLPLPRFVLLAPDEDESGWSYTLFVEGEMPPETAMYLDRLLRRNPHYDWCRQLGQLGPPRLFHVSSGGFETFIARECGNGKRIGDVKPCSLSTQAGWSKCFAGYHYPASHLSVLMV